jgi:predicted alpha/beta hydrolase family esterase
LGQSKIFEKKLGSKIVIPKNMGHFTEDDGITEIPVVLQEVLKVAK